MAELRQLLSLTAIVLAVAVVAACDDPAPEAAPEGSPEAPEGPPEVPPTSATPSTEATTEVPPTSVTPTRPVAARTFTFTDVTDAASIRFEHDNGATEERFLPETMGSGVAVFDADGDLWPDLFFVDSMPVADLGKPTTGGHAGALYRNRGDGTFEDVTAGSGLDGRFLGMGVAVGDVDNDGDNDLLITGVGGERLFLGNGDGTFDDASRTWGLATSGFASSAAFLDADRDGWLDLFVGRYVTWSPESDLPCRPDGENRIYCTPEAYPGAVNRLYRNVGGQRFEDVTAASGVGAEPGKTLGVAVLDLDGDSRPDLAVANDTTRNFLFRNGSGTDGPIAYEDVGVALGVALGPSGSPRGAMGIDAADLDGDGRSDLVIGNFAQEMASLYRQRAGDTFADHSAVLGVGLHTLMHLAFGTLAVDLDADGRLDLAFANGHIEPEIARFQAAHRYAQPLALFRNVGGRGFGIVEPEPGSTLARPLVGRGLASGDLDGDGDLDLVVTQNGRSAVVLRNDAPAKPTLRLYLEGRRSNRSAFGTRVEVELADRTIVRWLVSGGSYLSASEPVLTIGLGDAPEIRAVRVAWPSGVVQELGALAPGRHDVVEPMNAR